MTNRIIYYYQTFVGLNSILNQDTPVTHIHLSAIHFGLDENYKPYIHLNNYRPDYERYNKVWDDIKTAQELGIKIVLMVGGAGSAYTDLFNNYDVYFPLLINVINKYKLDGVDLDIEERVALSDVKNLINDLDQIFDKDFIISMAPIQSSLQSNNPGMGCFVYKDLFNSKEGQRINYFNGQFYSDFSFNAYKTAIDNGYPEEKVVMGMISSQNFQTNLKVMKEIVMNYPNAGGFFNWEYFSSPPEYPNNPGAWADQVSKCIHDTQNRTIYEMIYDYFFF